MNQRTINGQYWSGTRFLTAMRIRSMTPADLARELGVPTERVEAWIMVGMVSMGYSAQEIADHLHISSKRAEWWKTEGLDKHGWADDRPIEPNESEMDRIVFLLRFPLKFYYADELDLIPPSAISF